MELNSLGFIGFGSFGQFIVPHLLPFFDLYIYDKRDISKDAERIGVKTCTLEEALSKEIVLFGVPVQYLEELLIESKDKINPHALVLDVSSVKIKPMEMMQKYLPETVDIVGLHPLFGPQSGKYGISGLNLVVCYVRTKYNNWIENFFANDLKLNVMVRTPELHDQQMAYVQALTHFIGRSINSMDIPDVEQKTPAYQSLLDIKRNLGQDSFDLFLTIENENPYAKAVREQFILELSKLNGMLR
ncbi:MAG: prephenate dehydrogenase/arogenate dehydrogenase family protein [Cytophagales bacterium]|nr:prephenate dehydrogenase/arogenate dehydrogenase family protein [Cytophagales bacterium]